jgi:CBS domain-containing protein
MRVQEIMTENPACCTPEQKTNEAAKMMVECDCGELPVVDDKRKPVGVITDRDIVVRVVARDKDPRECQIREAMTSPAITVAVDASLEECRRLMEENQIRRIPVVDKSGTIVGIVALADIVRHANEDAAAELVRDVSTPTKEPSQAGRQPH